MVALLIVLAAVVLLAVVLVAMTVRDYFLYYNENGKQGKNKS